MTDTVTMHDDFPVVEYDGGELSYGDTVWVATPGLSGVGFWAHVNEDVDDHSEYVSLRYWGESSSSDVARVNIKYEQVHSCECGAYGPTSWRICHPEA